MIQVLQRTMQRLTHHLTLVAYYRYLIRNVMKRPMNLNREGGKFTHSTNRLLIELFLIWISSICSRVVPTRPQFVQALPPQSLESPEVKTCRYPYKVINFDPSCHFYRSWSKISDKDYVISPEWSSEKSLIRAGISSRAKTGLSLRHDLHE